jgi:hypothetical protein
MEDIQGKIFPLEHVGTHPDRREHGVGEDVYAREWDKQNAVHPWSNYGQCLLELILSRPGTPWGDLTQRDVTVAASVVQWLGTNCGRGFISECERMIEIETGQKRRAEHVASVLMRAP